MKSVAVLCLFTLSALAAEHAPGKRPFTATDYYSLETPGDPQISPDGKLIAYTVTSIDRKQNKKRTEIWMAAVDGSAAPWPFAAAGNSSAPRWRPDGRALAFISARADPQSAAPSRPQVYLMLMSGGDPRKLTDLKNGVTGFQWAPDGASVACVGKVGRSDNAVASKERSDVRDYVNPAYK